MSDSGRQYLPAVIIIVLYLVVASLFAWRVPDWQAPDEPAHYNYIAQVASGDLLPVIQMGDWDNDYLEDLKANDFAPELLSDLDQIRYENHQPPLYYWLAAPFYSISGGNLLIVRLYSVLLGAVSLLLAYAVMQELFPKRSELALAALALMAFLPQHVHILASVNNDALALPVMAGLLLLCLRYLNGRLRDPLWLGIGLGVAILSKTTIYFMAAVVLLTLVLRWREQRDTWRRLLSAMLRVALPAGIVALLYWGRNLSVYGFPDFLGLRQHDQIVIGQLRTAELIDQIGWNAYLERAFRTTFQSFWGQFGWMEAPMADAIPGIMTLIFVVMLLALAGVLVSTRYRLRRSGDAVPVWALPSGQVPASVLWLLTSVFVLALLQFLYYNLTFVQFQGRYIFTGLIPITCGLVAGLDVWLLRWSVRWSWLRWLPLLLFGSLLLLDVYLIWRVIPGALS